MLFPVPFGPLALTAGEKPTFRVVAHTVAMGQAERLGRDHAPAKVLESSRDRKGGTVEGLSSRISLLTFFQLSNRDKSSTTPSAKS